jgi:hypothetical protein
MTVTTRDLRRLVALGDPARLAEAGDPLPPSILRDLAELVPCDDVIYQVHDAHRQEFLAYQGLQPPALENAATTAYFWDHFWVWPSAMPEVTGNHSQVITDADAEVSKHGGLQKTKRSRSTDRRAPGGYGRSSCAAASILGFGGSGVTG